MSELQIVPDVSHSSRGVENEEVRLVDCVFETQRLKKLGLKISQIARALSLSASDDKKIPAQHRNMKDT